MTINKPNKTGIINVYKEKGFTSHDVVAILRKLTGCKAGHTGTLDPAAEGVLPICLGRATKLADYIMAADKTYVAEFVPGITTDTYDTSGEIVTRNAVDLTTADVAQAAAGFVGKLKQLPPMYSAIKINGKKLYELARKGESVERKPRDVVVHSIRVLEREEAAVIGCVSDRSGVFFLEVHCSKGTYIRSLCADMGEVLGCGAAMGALTRTQSGTFFLENAVKLDKLREAAQTGGADDYIQPVDTVLPHPRVQVLESGVAMALNGNPLPITLLKPLPEGERFWVCSPDGTIIGLYTLEEKKGRLRSAVQL